MVFTTLDGQLAVAEAQFIISGCRLGKAGFDSDALVALCDRLSDATGEDMRPVLDHHWHSQRGKTEAVQRMNKLEKIVSYMERGGAGASWANQVHLEAREIRAVMEWDLSERIIALCAAHGVRVRRFAKQIADLPFEIRGTGAHDWHVADLLDEELHLPGRASDLAMRVVSVLDANEIEVTGWSVAHEVPKPQVTPSHRDPVLLMRVGAYFLEVFRWNEAGGQ